jgi:hypothetical protein
MAHRWTREGRWGRRRRGQSTAQLSKTSSFTGSNRTTWPLT